MRPWMIFGVSEQCRKELKLPRMPQLLTARRRQPQQSGPGPGLRRPVLRGGRRRVLDGGAGRLEPHRHPQRGPRALHLAARRGHGHGGRDVGHSGYQSWIQYLPIWIHTYLVFDLVQLISTW